MPDFDRSEPFNDSNKIRLIFTTLTFGSYFICKSMVKNEIFDNMFSKMGMVIPSRPNSTRIRILYTFILVRAMRQSYWMWKLCKSNFPIGAAIGVPIYNLILDLITIGSAIRHPKQKKLTTTDYIGIAAFLIGSFIESGYDSMRNSFKQDPNNKGKPYLGGFAQYVVHPNYFGYTLWRSGLCLLSGNIYTILIPIGMSLDFVFSAIPGLQKHNLNKYGDVYQKYLNDTKSFIPFLL